MGVNWVRNKNSHYECWKYEDIIYEEAQEISTSEKAAKNFNRSGAFEYCLGTYNGQRNKN